MFDLLVTKKNVETGFDIFIALIGAVIGTFGYDPERQIVSAVIIALSSFFAVILINFLAKIFLSSKLAQREIWPEHEYDGTWVESYVGPFETTLEQPQLEARFKSGDFSIHHALFFIVFDKKKMEYVLSGEAYELSASGELSRYTSWESDALYFNTGSKYLKYFYRGRHFSKSERRYGMTFIDFNKGKTKNVFSGTGHFIEDIAPLKRRHFLVEKVDEKLCAMLNIDGVCSSDDLETALHKRKSFLEAYCKFNERELRSSLSAFALDEIQANSN